MSIEHRNENEDKGGSTLAKLSSNPGIAEVRMALDNHEIDARQAMSESFAITREAPKKNLLYQIIVRMGNEG